ncbi:pyridoxamine 5'-phosphate oxidase family protein [Streptomyces albicerus]|uniref:pyridoxamine 5'-phosphate oxidase family protein n=1 Tax=Streptomyces albicerus TaxID=2569859 RepID=UPI00124B3B96|nr:pyridoxamine 5'-phosphate oxidase family protein [Streptomyces albicerus]
MSEHTPPNAASAAAGGARGDIGRRIAQRREELGLTRQETAERAGTVPSYLQYLEEQSTATPGTGVLIRLADTLETTVAALRGGGADLPPGIGRAAGHPELVELNAEECRARLSTHGVGRIAVSTPAGPVVVPVNYSVVDDAVAFRTAPDATPAAAAGTQVAFEVDHIDEALSRGWSVLVRGPAREVTDPDAVRQLEERAYSGPWPGGERGMWVCIDPADITGRSISVR